MGNLFFRNSNIYILKDSLNNGQFGTTNLVIRDGKYYVSKEFKKKGTKIITRNNICIPKLIIESEYNIIKNCNHPNIISFIDYYENESNIFLVIDYIKGCNLYDYSNNIILNEIDIKYIFYQLLNGLNYLHRNQIIHRDIKPENIMIGRNNHVVIIDFNCSEYISIKNNSIFGTIPYKAPEIHYEEEYSYNSDIFSLGATLYFIVYKMHAYNKELYYNPLNEWTNVIYKENSIYSSNLIHFIKNCVLIDRLKRYTVATCYFHRWIFNYSMEKLETIINNQNIEYKKTYLLNK